VNSDAMLPHDWSGEIHTKSFLGNAENGRINKNSKSYYNPSKLLFL
jgi:hypothetical protein